MENALTLNDDHKKKINIDIPIPMNGFDSLQIQLIIIEFIETYLTETQTKKTLVSDLKNMYSEHTQVLIAKTFKTKK